MSNPIETPLFINGVAEAASTGAFYDIVNPARPDELVGRSAEASPSDCEAAIAAAKAAFPAWSRLSMAERAAYLTKIADELNADAEEMQSRIALFVREHGKIRFEATLEIERLADRFRQVAGFAARVDAEEKIAGPRFDTIVARHARGVTTLIVPWNWPLAILGSKLPQALLAGNTVIIKLSEFASLAPALSIMKLAALLPPGVVNLITGDGTKIGPTLIEHKDVRQVNFTGSIPVGQTVMQSAAKTITPVTLELGGNDAGIVLDDIVLDDGFFQRLYMGAFMTTGQICMALKRLYVHRSVFDDVVSGLSDMLDRQVIGDGLVEGTTMGPMNNQRQKARVEALTNAAKDAGADIRYFGQIADQTMFETGYFLQPSLVIHADPALAVVREEQFGPILPILPFDSDDEALFMANDSEYGLNSSIWSGDIARAESLARQVEAGFTHINAHGPAAMDGLSPFGGVKQSGIGRNFGYEGVLQFQEYHAISGPSGALIS